MYFCEMFLNLCIVFAIMSTTPSDPRTCISYKVIFCHNSLNNRKDDRLVLHGIGIIAHFICGTFQPLIVIHQRPINVTRRLHQPLLLLHHMPKLMFQILFLPRSYVYLAALCIGQRTQLGGLVRMVLHPHILKRDIRLRLKSLAQRERQFLSAAVGSVGLRGCLLSQIRFHFAVADHTCHLHQAVIRAHFALRRELLGESMYWYCSLFGVIYAHGATPPLYIYVSVSKQGNSISFYEDIIQ